MKRISLIVAGGTGTRMGYEEPKQFLLLKGRPMLMHSIEKFARSSEVYVVLPADWQEHWKLLCAKHQFRVGHTLVSGGIKRADSVKAGLDAMSGEAIVAVHDAARPLISEALIEKLFSEALRHGNAIPAIKPGDSMRLVEEGISVSVDRNKFVMVQTPQCFALNELKSAFESMHFSDFTDEASLMEAAGSVIHLIEGERTNIKITVPADLQYAETFIL